MTDPKTRPPIVPISTKRHRSLTGRIVWRSIAVGGVLVIAVLLLNYILSMRLLTQIVYEVAQESADTTVARIERVFTRAAANAQTLAKQVVNSSNRSQALKRSIEESIQPFVETDTDIYGMSVSLEPNVLSESLGAFAPYFFRTDDGLEFVNLAKGQYNYQQWDWYTEPKKTGKAGWSSPYYDTGGGNTLMTTYSTPIDLEDGTFAGVATTDLALDFLQELATEIELGKVGTLFILSADGRIVAHQHDSERMQTSIPPHPDARVQATDTESIDEAEAEFWMQQLKGVATDSSQELRAPCPHRRGTCWVSVQPLLDTGWRVIVVVPEGDLQSRVLQLVSEVSLFGIAGLIALIVVITEMTRSIMQPLASLAHATKDIGHGNLDIDLPELDTRDELGALTTSFIGMRDSLQDYIAELAETTAREHRLKSEIEIAQGIQMSMVPGQGRVALSGSHYEVFASLRPARTIGGDLYYFAEDDGKLRFILGDVSDKGVPAALVMAKTVAIYSASLGGSASPGAVLASLNAVLSRDNETFMFVTALCGVLDLATGELTIANAGHMNPIRTVGPSSEPLEVEGGAALGVVPDEHYPDVQATLQPGTSLVMYTDGLSEAYDESGEEFGVARLEQSLHASVALGPEIGAEQQGERLLEDVDSFATEDGVFDDCTLLIVRYAT